MRRHIATALTALFIANSGLVPGAHAQTMTIQLLREACQRSDGFPVCAAYVRGVLDALITIGSAEALLPSFRREYGVCPQDGSNSISGAQAVQAFTNWASDNPVAWQKPAFSGVKIALSETFPCN